MKKVKLNRDHFEKLNAFNYNGFKYMIQNMILIFQICSENDLKIFRNKF